MARKTWDEGHEARLKAQADELADALDNNLVDSTNRWQALRAYGEILQAYAALKPPAASS